MTSLAGYKIRKHREEQVPKQTRAEFGAMFGAPVPTVTGWEDGGKKPRPAMMNAIVASGIVTHADWYRPARCEQCDRVADDQGLADCRAAQCPLAMLKAA